MVGNVARVENPSPTPDTQRKIEGIVTGLLDRIDADGSFAVSVPELQLREVRTCSSLVNLAPTDVGRRVALAFDHGNRRSPLILGLMWQPRSRSVPAEAEVIVDGGRVELTAAREIELRCGEAAIVLTADGRIELRGSYITSHATSTQRILGASVNVN